MKLIGSLLLIFGIAAIIYGFLDRVPTILEWIYQWGEGPSWAIKVGFVVLGAILLIMASRKKAVETTEHNTNP